VHPQNKAPLGEPLTLLALAKAYGRNVEYSGPLYESMTIDGSKIQVKFTHRGGGLAAKDGPLKWFTIAGVRYAWENCPKGCNPYNAAGLRAAPFRTDSGNASYSVFWSAFGNSVSFTPLHWRTLKSETLWRAKSGTSATWGTLMRKKSAS
jgi:hypothetical protein